MFLRLRLLFVALGAGCLSSMGCAGDEGPSSHSESGELAAWSVADAPTLIVDSEEPSPLHLVSAAVQTSAGIVVVNASEPIIRLYDNEGEYVRGLGSVGEGPEDIGRAGDVALLGGDTILLHDVGNSRLIKVCAPLRLCGSTQLAPELQGRMEVAMGPHVVMEDNRSSGGEGLGNVSHEYWILDRNDQSVPGRWSVDGVPVWTTVDDGMFRMTQLPFSLPPEVTVVGDRVLTATNNDHSLVWRGLTGDSLGSVPVPFERRAVTQGDLNALLDERLTRLDEERRPAYRRRFGELPARDFRSPVLRLLTDRVGMVWVERENFDDRSAHHWVVLTPSGRRVAELRTPDDFVIRDIGEDYILGVHSDALDVQTVRRFDLRRD